MLERLLMLFAGLKKDKRGIAGLGILIAMIIGLIVVVALFPMAINTFNDANTTAWNASLVSIWTVLPILAIIGVALAFIYGAIHGSEGSFTPLTCFSRIRNILYSLKKNKRGSITNTAVTIAIGLLLIAILVPVGLNMYYDANLLYNITGEWSASLQSIWAILPILVVVGILLTIIGIALKVRED